MAAFAGRLLATRAYWPDSNADSVVVIDSIAIDRHFHRSGLSVY
jgi:hypothetical protein